METADVLLLDALKAAIHNGKIHTALSGETRTALLRQAVRHGVLPLVLDACGGDALGAEATSIVFRQTAEQILKMRSFLHIYRRLRAENLRLLVLKGPVCAALYPKPETRLFSDIDLLSLPGEFDRTRDILLKLGCHMTGESKNTYELTFYLPGSPLVLELHGTAFSENDAYGDMNSFFMPDKIHTRTITVQGEEINTLGANETFLYLLCHSLKHFLHGGCGIRSVCDLLLFTEKHANALDALYLRRCCEKISALAFLTALFLIGEKHLGFKKSESLALLSAHPVPNEDDLLQDILASGVHGGAEKSRLHSANITLHAVAAQKAGKRGRFSVLRAAFPSAKELNCPSYRLPLAWGRRFVRFGRENLHTRTDFRESIAIGKRRTALLREYHIIK